MKFKSPTAIIILGLIVLLLVFIFLPIAKFNNHAKLGDIALRSESKYLALMSYENAEKDWQFLKFNLPFNNSKKQAEEARASYFKSYPSIIVFLKDGVTDEQSSSLIAKIKKNPEVGNLKYVSNEEALKIYRERNKNEPALLELVTAEILPGSIEVFTLNSEIVPKLASDLRKEAEISDVITPGIQF